MREELSYLQPCRMLMEAAVGCEIFPVEMLHISACPFISLDQHSHKCKPVVFCLFFEGAGILSIIHCCTKQYSPNELGKGTELVHYAFCKIQNCDVLCRLAIVIIKDLDG